MSYFRLPYPKMAAGGRRLLADPKKLWANIEAIARAIAGRLTGRSLSEAIKIDDARFIEARTVEHMQFQLGPNLGGAGTPERVLYAFDLAGFRLLYVTMQRLEYKGSEKFPAVLDTDLPATARLKVFKDGVEIGRAHPAALDGQRWRALCDNFTETDFDNAEVLGLETNANAGALKYWIFDVYMLCPWRPEP